MIGYLYSHKNLYMAIQYFVLFLILVVSSLVFTRLSDPLLRFFVIILDAVLYFFWGIWHHYHIDRFGLYILLEYSLVSAFLILLSAIGLGIIRFF